MTLRPSPRALAAAIPVLLLAGAPTVSADWGPPTPVPGASGAELWPGDLTLGFDRDGRGLATWSYGFHGARVGTATSGRGGDWQRGPDTPPGEFGPSAQYGRDRAMTLVPVQSSLPGVSGVFVRFGRFGDPPQSAVRIGSRDVSDVAIAADARGDAVAVAGTGRSGPTVIQAASRREGGRFGRLRTVSRTWSRFPAVAIDERGTAIVVWWRKYGRAAHRLVEARLHRRRGGWGPIERIADLPPTSPRLSVAAAGGTFLVAWASHDISSGGEDMGTNIGAAVRRTGGWDARTLERTATGPVARDPGSAPDLAGVRAFVDRRGRGTVVWAGQEASLPRVKALRVQAGRFGPAVALPVEPGVAQYLADSALAPDGRLAVGTLEWAPVASHGRLVVATTPPGPQAFVPEVVSPAAQQVVGARVAFDAAGGTLVALWVDRADDGTATLYVARRSGEPLP